MMRNYKQKRGSSGRNQAANGAQTGQRLPNQTATSARSAKEPRQGEARETERVENVSSVTPPPPRTTTSNHRRENETPRPNSIVSMSGTENTPPNTVESGASRLFTPPVVPHERGAERRNILAPLRLHLVGEPGHSTGGTAEPNDLADQLRQFMEKQESFNEELMLTIQEKERENEELRARSRRKRLPKVLTAHVREIYKHLITNEDDGTAPPTWDVTKCFGDEENKQLNAAILNGVRSTDSETPTITIKAAMRVHFRTKKREFYLQREKREKSTLKEQRRRSRLNSKKTLRLKVLRDSSSIAETDKTRIKAVMTIDYISSEHTVSEESDNGGSRASDESEDSDSRGPKEFTVHKLAWRSAEADRVMESLDRRVQKRRGRKGRSMLYKRKAGANSTRSFPDDAPAWAVRNPAPPRR